MKRTAVYAHSVGGMSSRLAATTGPGAAVVRLKTPAPTSGNLSSEPERGRPGCGCRRKTHRYEHRSAVPREGWASRAMPCPRLPAQLRPKPGIPNSMRTPRMRLPESLT